MTLLHLFNGDSLLDALSGKVKGTCMVWKEALCQGPLSYKVSHGESLDLREQYWVSQYGLEARESFQEFRQILSWLVDQDYLSQFEEVVLWFGEDYFCQMNLLALLSTWHQEGIQLRKISLVSAHFHPEVGHVTCLGNLSPEQLLGIFPDRKEIRNEDLEVADILWQLLTAKDPRPLNHFKQSVPHDRFNWVKGIRLHGLLFPFLQSGLNALEWRILGELAEGPLPFKQLIGNVLRKDVNFGLGDSQYVAIAQRLSPVLIQADGTGWDSIWALTPKGREVVAESLSLNRRELPEGQVGGASDHNFAWSEDEGKLVEREVLL